MYEPEIVQPPIAPVVAVIEPRIVADKNSTEPVPLIAHPAEPAT